MYEKSEDSTKTMDYRKNMNTPRDMVDDEMLLRLMREPEPSAEVFGCNVRKENRRRNNSGGGNCGCRTPEVREPRKRYPEAEREEHCGCETREWRNENNGNTECGRDSCVKDDRMKHFALAMAYVPWQEWEKIYEDEEKALMRGTLFEALDLPWYPTACETCERDGNCENKSGTCRRCGDGDNR
jgi:hypothetical protein